MADGTWGAKATDATHEELADLFEQFKGNNLDGTKKDFLEDMARIYKLHQTQTGGSFIAQDIPEFTQILNRAVSILIGSGERFDTHLSDLELKHQEALDKKEAIIDALQEDLDDAKDELRIAYEERDNSEMEKKQAKEVLVNLQNDTNQKVNQLTSSIDDKQALITEYQEKNDTLTGLVKEYKAAEEQNKDLTRDILAARSKIASLLSQKERDDREIEILQKQLKDQKAKFDETVEEIRKVADFEIEKALLEQKINHQTEVQQLREQYNSKVADLLERIERPKDEHQNKE